jgi:hypothetical protein
MFTAHGHGLGKGRGLMCLPLQQPCAGGHTQRASRALAERLNEVLVTGWIDLQGILQGILWEGKFFDTNHKNFMGILG